MIIYLLIIGKEYQIFFCQSVGFLGDESVPRPFRHNAMYVEMTKILIILYFDSNIDFVCVMFFFIVCVLVM